MNSNLRVYPWFQFAKNLTFWQATWFLFFQDQLSASEAIFLYAIYDIATTALEVPSGYLSDRLGRRLTLILATGSVLAATVLLTIGGGIEVYVTAQICLGAGMAFASGTDSALLYESLAREGRGQDVDVHELTAWRFSFTALAVSAFLGGAMAIWDMVLPFAATAVAALAALLLALKFREPPAATSPAHASQPVLAMLTHPVLGWCFVLAFSMYALSHVPFVFGQPFILEALEGYGLAAEAPAVSGAVSALMMAVSVLASWGAMGVRRTLGLSGVLLLALGMQIGLIAALAMSNHVAVIALLVLRMVPDALAKPFILARIQPLLADHRRATYLSMQSFVGRLLFAGSLLVFAAGGTEGALAYAEIQGILVWYAAAGVAVFAALVLSARLVETREVDAP